MRMADSGHRIHNKTNKCSTICEGHLSSRIVIPGGGVGLSPSQAVVGYKIYIHHYVVLVIAFILSLENYYQFVTKDDSSVLLVN